MRSTFSPFLLAALAAGAAGLTAASCGPVKAECNPAECTGCCDAEGVCQPGFLNGACGISGAQCVACAPGSTCGNGTCLTPSNTCAQPGAGCTNDSDCCSDRCLGGACATEDGGSCKGLNAACFVGAECCTGHCENMLCADPPEPDGGTGTDAGMDGGNPNCKSNGAGCFVAAECCSGVCSGMVCGGTDGGVPSCGNITGDRATQVCLRWTCDRADRNEGSWTGDVPSCLPGNNTVGRENALKILNLQRFLAQLPEVTTDSVRNSKAQECALIMDANGMLSHTPDSTWTCYTANGGEAAGSSNIATAPGVSAVDLYMVDPGNATTLGHRRWILSPGLGPVGLGTTSSASCMWVVGGSGTATRNFVAWPAPGPFPIQAISPFGGGSTVNDTGWSVQTYGALDLTGASVSVMEDGVTPRSVTVTPLDPGYGSPQALRFNPVGWAPSAGHSYSVSVTGIPTPIQYTVEFVDCQ